jgi:hypothetical protein
MFGDRLHLEEDPSLTLSARIMCPELMVRVTIREAASFRIGYGRLQGACSSRVRPVTLIKLMGEQMCTPDGACIDDLRDGQAPHPSHVADRLVLCTRGGTRTDL